MSTEPCMQQPERLAVKQQPTHLPQGPVLAGQTIASWLFAARSRWCVLIQLRNVGIGIATMGGMMDEKQPRAKKSLLNPSRKKTATARLCLWTRALVHASDGEKLACLAAMSGVEAPSVFVCGCVPTLCLPPPLPPTTHSDLHTKLHRMWVSVIGFAGKAAAGREAAGAAAGPLPTPDPHFIAALV